MKKSTCFYFICSVVYVIMIVSCLFSSIQNLYYGAKIESANSNILEGVSQLLIFIAFMPFLVISFVKMDKSLKNKDVTTDHAVIILLIGTILLVFCTTTYRLWRTIEMIKSYNEAIAQHGNSMSDIVNVLKANRFTSIISFIQFLVQASCCLGSAIAMYVFWKKEKLDTNQPVKVIEDENSNKATADNSI